MDKDFIKYQHPPWDDKNSVNKRRQRRRKRKRIMKRDCKDQATHMLRTNRNTGEQTTRVLVVNNE